MKRILFFILISVSLLVFYSCASNSSEEKPQVQASDDITDVDEVVDTEVSSVEDDVVFLDDVQEVPDNEDEYLRSTNELSAEESVSKQEFEEDKAEILRIIAELEKIMKKGDFEGWKKYIAPDSINYYSAPANIRKVQKKLPDKTTQLHGIKDYFTKVFIKIRQGSSVEEIRYISKNNIRGGYYKADKTTFVITYYFVKIDGKWYVHIPPVE